MEIRGSYGCAAEYEMALDWLMRGRLPRDFPLDKSQEAFELLEGPYEEGKTLLRIGSHS